MEQPKNSDPSKISVENTETIPLTATLRHVQSHPSMAHSPPGPGSRSLGSLNKDIIVPQTIVSHGKQIESPKFLLIIYESCEHLYHNSPFACHALLLPGVLSYFLLFSHLFYVSNFSLFPHLPHLLLDDLTAEGGSYASNN